MKKDFPKFKADFRKICEANGGVFNVRDTIGDGAAFRIPTKFGTLRASIHCDAHHNRRGGVYLESIFLQFHRLHRAGTKVRYSPSILRVQPILSQVEYQFHGGLHRRCAPGSTRGVHAPTGTGEGMNSPGIDPAFSPMITFYSVAFYQLFDRIGLDKARETAERASEISGEHALQYESNQGIEYELPHVDGKVSPGKVLAAMSAFVVWQQKLCKVDYFPESVMLSAALDGYSFTNLGNELMTTTALKNEPPR